SKDAEQRSLSSTTSARNSTRSYADIASPSARSASPRSHSTASPSRLPIFRRKSPKPRNPKSWKRRPKKRPRRRKRQRNLLQRRLQQRRRNKKLKRCGSPFLSEN